VQALRHYDSLGLLKPSEVDPSNGYRFYQLDQISRLNRILALKDLGFSLAQISRLLENNDPPENLAGLLRLKQQELREIVQENLDRLERIDARLRWIEQSRSMPTSEVVLKSVRSIQVVSVRGIIPSFWDESPLWNDLLTRLKKAGLEPCAPCLSICHTSEPEIDVEVCAPIKSPANTMPDLCIYELPAIDLAASTILKGPFAGIAPAYASLIKWVDDNGFCVTGPDREIYLRLPDQNFFYNDPDAITELQIPVCRKPSA